ncbi:MAG: hypothetical protein AAFR14_05575 [Bacteroidota bacterium]
MKTKIVLWGEKEGDSKVLLAIELIEADNVVRIHQTPEREATEDFYNTLMNQWRKGEEIQWTESTEQLDRPLSMTEGLLPDDLRTQRQDILARAKTEWHFVVLSSKLFASYADEIADFQEKVNGLSSFDNRVWEDMKSFWSKVQAQVYEKNLFREHAVELRSKTDQVFDTLKSLKKAANDELERTSRDYLAKFSDRLSDIEARIEKGLGLQPIFNELKNVQQDFKKAKFTRKHHNEIWGRIDKAFKVVKEKKYGKKSDGSSGAQSRLANRYDGLLNAIDRMEKSMKRDHQDMAFQKKRINDTDGQLELQIRQAKMAMIEERVASKQVKLDDMLKTKGELEKKMEAEKKRAEAREAKQKREEALKKAKQSVKEGIADDIATNMDALSEREKELIEASEKLKAIKQKRQSKQPPKEETPTETVQTAAPQQKTEVLHPKDSDSDSVEPSSDETRPANEVATAAATEAMHEIKSMAEPNNKLSAEAQKQEE